MSGVEAFNALSDADTAECLSTCLHGSGWVASVAAGRPYPDRESLLATAYRFGLVLSDRDLAQALSHHPRIGERPAGTGAEAAHSRSEQGGVDAADADLAERLRQGNLAYEKRFDRVFLIRAAGRSGAEILSSLTQRLVHDDQTEDAVIRDQLAQIAQLRLDAVLTDLEKD